MIEMTPDLLRRVLDGDQDAREEARELLPKAQNLFGRWATHPKYGRVLCVSDNVDHDGLVNVYRRTAQRDSGSMWECLPFDSLEFDPTELVTEQDFLDAPEGTIVSQPGRHAHEKREGWWRGYNFNYSNGEIAGRAPWEVVRWGKGEQA